MTAKRAPIPAPEARDLPPLTDAYLKKLRHVYQHSPTWCRLIDEVIRLRKEKAA